MGFVDIEALGPEGVADNLGRRGVVVNDEDALAHRLQLFFASEPGRRCAGRRLLAAERYRRAALAAASAASNADRATCIEAIPGVSRSLLVS
jgi:hypothetical protein